MLLAIWIKLAPSNVSRKVPQLKTCSVSQAITPPSMIGTKVACKNGTRIALSHNPMKGGFFASMLGLNDITCYLPIRKSALAGDDIRRFRRVFGLSEGSACSHRLRGLPSSSGSPSLLHLRTLAPQRHMVSFWQ